MFYNVVRVPVDYEFCVVCGKSMGRGQLVALSEGGRLAHYGCAKDRKMEEKIAREKTKSADCNGGNAIPEPT